MTATETTSSLSDLLSCIRRQRGIDFTAYKESSLERRLAKRLTDTGTDDYAAYLDHLQATPEELTRLLDTIFINVTAFFRDASAWEAIESIVIPALTAERVAHEPVRIWCPGSATGEEPLSIAMLLAEHLGDEAFHQRVRIYATDIDEDALTHARSGVYSPSQLDGLKPDLIERYFETVDEQLVFRQDLRRSIIFGRHNLLADAPISNLDLVICRNTLMYFNREAQNRILARFHFALRDSGFLFLGKAEMPLTRRHLFAPLDPRSRVFAKVARVSHSHFRMARGNGM